MSIMTSVLLATVAGAIVGVIVGSASGVKKGLTVLYISLLSSAALIAFVTYMQTRTYLWLLISVSSIYGIMQIVRAARRLAPAYPPTIIVRSFAGSTQEPGDPPELPGSSAPPAGPGSGHHPPAIGTRKRGAFGTGSKIFVGLFATPIVFILSSQTLSESMLSKSSDDAPFVFLLAFCLVGLLWVGIIAWIRAGSGRGV